MARVSKPARPTPQDLYSIPMLKQVWGGGIWSYPPTSTFTTYKTYHRDYVSSRTPHFNTTAKRDLPVNYHEANIFYSNQGSAVDFRIDEITNYATRVEGKYTDVFVKLAAPDTSPSVSARNAAIYRLIDSISTNAGLGVDVGEIHQTVSMIAVNATRIARAAKSLRRFDLYGACNALRIVPSTSLVRRFNKSARVETDGFRLLANYWLELRYGWIPLVHDIKDAVQLTVNHITRSNVWITAGRGHSVDKDVREIPYPTSVGGPGAPTYMGKEVHMKSTSYNFTVYYKHEPSLLSYLNGLGFGNPLSIAWELLPFSFVVDWFLPVGQFLNALHAYDGLTFHKGSESSKVVVNVSGSVGASYRVKFPGYPATNVTQYGNYEDISVKFRRVALGAFPTPTPPNLKSPVTVIHAANALALLVSVFKH